MNARKIYIHVLVVFAIIGAGISPACAFISGNMAFIEICAADGSIQRVEVDAAFDPFAEGSQDSGPISTEHLEAMEKCPFCFSASHQKYGVVRSADFVFLPSPAYIRVGAGSFVPASYRAYDFYARGPPRLS